MYNKSQTKIFPIILFCLVLVGLSISFFVLANSFNPEDNREIGYEFLDNNNVVHIWNTQDDYFFEKNAGIQLTNHYQDYWTRNIFCIGYYDGEEWVKIKCADELTNFNKSIETDNLTYVNATLWKDITYEGYDLRLGVRYHLRLDDETLSITIYGKNIGAENIPFELGFAWKITDVEIATEEEDHISLNGTEYHLTDTFDLTFKNMTDSYFDEETNETIITPIPRLRIHDRLDFLNIDWNENLNYAVKMFGNGNQEDFYVALLINAGLFGSGEEKQTTFQWIDAPFDPVPVGFVYDIEGIDSLDAVEGVHVSGDYAYTVSRGATGNNLAVWNISAHGNPVSVGGVYDIEGNNSLEGAFGIFVSGDYAYTTANTDDSFAVWNISAHGNPISVGGWSGAYNIGDSNGGVRNVFVLDGYAYLTSYVEDSLLVFNVTDPGDPVFLGNYTSSSGDYSLDGASAVFVSGDYAYVVTVYGSDKLVVFNISEHGDPVPVGFYGPDTSGLDSLEQVRDVFVSGDYAYTVSYQDDSLAVWNISAHGNPVFVGGVSDNSGNYSLNQVYSVHVSGDYAYTVNNYDDTFAVWDISAHGNPEPVGTYSSSTGDYSIDGTNSIYVYEGYAYVTSYTDDRLVVFDVTVEAGDETPPTYSNNQTNTTIAGESCNFSITYDDDTALHPDGQWVFSTNNTGTWTNESAESFTSTPQSISTIKTLNSTVGLTIGYRWYANDSAGNNNNTPIYTLITTDETPPSISITYPTAITYSENVSSLNYTYTETNPDSCWYSVDDGVTNSSAVNMGTNFTDITSVGGSNTWTVYCNDTSNNINSDSVTFTLNVLWSNAGYPYSDKDFRTTKFITVDGNKFMLGPQQYTFLGADSYYLADYATNHTYDDDGNEINNSMQYVLEILNEAQYLNINVIRTWAGTQGSDDSHWIINESGGHYNLFEVGEPGNYSNKTFEALDWVIYEASKRNIRLQLVLINNWNDYGGMRWYVQKSPTTNKTYEDVDEDEDPNYYWSEFKDQFYDDENCRQYFRNYINFTLNRNNTYSNILYKDDPAIFSWLLANEPRAKSNGTGRGLIEEWATNMTAYIKSIDSNHLVGLGIEGWGYVETWGEGTDMIVDHNNTGVDFATYALHPDQWQYFAERSEHDGGGYVTEGTGTNAYVDWWTNDSDLSYNNRDHGDVPAYIPALGRYGYDNWVAQNVKWANEMDMPILLQEAGYLTVHEDAIKDRFYQQMIHNFYNEGGDGLMFWTLNHDDYYYSTDVDGDMDDGYGFYVSDDSLLREKSKSVLDAIDFTLTDNDGGSWVNQMNSYKYDFIVNIGFASDTVIDNCTLFLNVSNGTEWTNYYADQSNTSAIINDESYVFEKQFNDTDEEVYWYTECYGDGTTITSDVGHIQIQTGVPVVTLYSPEDSGFSNNDTTEFIYEVTETNGLLISFCELFIDDVLNKTDSTVTMDVNQTFSSLLSDGTTYNWYIRCTDTDDNSDVSETRSFTVDSTFPQIEIVYPSNNSNHTSNTIEINYTRSDTNLDSCWYSNDTYASNTTLVDCANITGITWSEGQHNVTIWANDSAGNENSSSVTFTIDTIDPTITFISQTPSDLMWNSTGLIEILFNITDASGINESSILFFNGVNHTHNAVSHFDWSYRFPESDKQPDGRRADNRNESKWLENVVWKESPDDIWSFSGRCLDCSKMNVIDNSSTHSYINLTKQDVHLMFPQTWYLERDKLLQENKTNQYINLYTDNLVKMALNISWHDLTENITAYVHYNIEPQNSVRDLIIYVCNSTYSTGRPEKSSNCQAGHHITGTDTRTINIYNSSYIEITGAVTNGMFGSVRVTRNMFLVYRAKATPITKSYRLYYANNSIADNTNFNDSNVMWTSTDTGNTWNMYNATPDVFYTFGQLDYEKVVYYVYACDNLGNCVNSTWQEDTLQAEPNLPPATPTVTYPEEGYNVSIPFYINWTTAGDPESDPYNASVHLYNQDGTINTTLADNNITDDEPYFYIDDTLPDGTYRINITLCDDSDCSSILTGWNFTIDSTLPVISIIVPTDGYSIYDYVSGSVPVFTNFSLTELYPDSCWHTIDGGVTNTSVPCLSGYNNFTFSLSSLGTFTLEISANDSAGNENSSSIQIIVSAYTGPEKGGGTTTDPSENIIVDFNLYNSTIMCEEVNKFLELRTSNYTSDQRESLKNSLALIFGFGIIDWVLDEYLENFEENCPEFVEPDEPVDVDDEDSEDNFWNSKAFLFIIIGVIIIFVILVILLDINYLSLKKLYHKNK